VSNELSVMVDNILFSSAISNNYNGWNLDRKPSL
jgi:hypothetical protein